MGNVIVFPLDLATTRLQHAQGRSTREKGASVFKLRSLTPVSLVRTLQRLVGRRGLKRLWSGARADILSTVISSFLYFFLFSALHKTVIRIRTRGASKTGKDLLGPMEEIFIGMAAGIIAKGVTLPISAISTRQQLDSDGERPPQSVVATLRDMLRDKGFTGLFSALPPSIPLALLPSLTLYIHSALLHVLVPARKRAHPDGATTFALAAVSNALATLPLYPLVLAKSLAQTAGRDYSLRASMDEIYTREGFRGLYRGLEGQLAKGLLSQGVMMLVKQRSVLASESVLIHTGSRRRLSRHTATVGPRYRAANGRSGMQKQCYAMPFIRFY